MTPPAHRAPRPEGNIQTQRRAEERIIGAAGIEHNAKHSATMCRREAANCSAASTVVTKLINQMLIGDDEPLALRAQKVPGLNARQSEGDGKRSPVNPCSPPLRTRLRPVRLVSPPPPRPRTPRVRTAIVVVARCATGGRRLGDTCAAGARWGIGWVYPTSSALARLLLLRPLINGRRRKSRRRNRRSRAAPCWRRRKGRRGRRSRARSS